MILDHVSRCIDESIRLHFPGAIGGSFKVTFSDGEMFGDVTTNVALAIAPLVKWPPREVAQVIAESLKSDAQIRAVDVAGAGFLNITLNDAVLVDALEKFEITSSPVDTRSDPIVFEYGQPNTHKVPHIGHLFSYINGESCVRLLESVGKHVKRANYQGDVGPHVAKCLWAYMKKNSPDPATLHDKIGLLQTCYQEGAQAYDDNASAKSEIDAINQKIYAGDPDLKAVWEKTRGWSVDAYKEFEQRLGIAYDRWYFESETFGPGQEIVEQNIGPVFEEDQGAVIFRGEQYGLHTRVFMNSRGNPTYEAKDLGLVQKKWEEFHFLRAVIETGNDQADYWRVEKQAIELLFPELKDKIQTLHHGMINLSGGKMSSRTGNIVTAFSLVEMVKDRAIATLDQSRGYSEDEQNSIAEKVGMAAIKYSFLKSSSAKDMVFDLETSISHEGNSGPYLLYAYARTQSILRKAGDTDAKFPADYSINNAERLILLNLFQYRDVVVRAAEEFAPHYVATYLFDLAQAYSTFYSAHKIISDVESETAFRLIITRAVSQTLNAGLALLGIETSERL
jgi:arginyl-tRNA synthetase